MDRRTLLAGIGMIRFGMAAFEEAIKKLGGPKFITLLQHYTDKGRKATLVGTIITGILNSSTLVTLISLGFVSAGMIKLVNAVGILIGANIGSTATGLLAGYLGFGAFNIAKFALPLVALGGILMTITSKKYRSYRAKLLVGFGLFFLGIGLLKDNVEAMSSVFNLAQYQDISLRLYGLIGVAITVLIQSSGAAGVMTLAAIGSGMISFEAGFALILGSNIGTTLYPFLISLSGSRTKQQVGITDLIFNIITVGVGIVFFHQFIWFTLEVLGFKRDPVMGNAVINLVFNVITALPFIPLVKPFTALITRILPEKESTFPLEILKHPLHKVEYRYDEDITLIYIQSLQKDKNYLTDKALEYISLIRGLDAHPSKEYADQAIEITYRKFDNEKHRELYDTIGTQLNLILEYINTLISRDITNKDRHKLLQLQHQFINISNACKSTKSNRESIIILLGSSHEQLKEVTHTIREYIHALNASIYQTLDQPRRHSLIENLQQELHHLIEYRDTLITRMSTSLDHGHIGEIDISSLMNMISLVAASYQDIIQTFLVKQSSHSTLSLN